MTATGKLLSLVFCVLVCTFLLLLTLLIGGEGSREQKENNVEISNLRQKIMVIKDEKLVARPLTPANKIKNFKRFRKVPLLFFPLLRHLLPTLNSLTFHQSTSPSFAARKRRAVIACEVNDGDNPTEEMESWLRKAAEEEEEEEEEKSVAEGLWNAQVGGKKGPPTLVIPQRVGAKTKRRRKSDFL